MASRGQSEHLKKMFLTRFTDYGCVRRACEEAGVGHTTVYKWRKNDLDFQQDFTDAETQAVSRLEPEALRRAVDGVEQPIFHGGIKAVPHANNLIPC